MSNELMLSGGTAQIQSLDNMSWSVQRQTRREIEQVAKRAIVANVHEQARAQLCQTALINTGVLSALEEHIIGIAPLAASRCQAIADAYVIGASKKLMQW